MKANFTLGDLVTRAAERFPDRIAIYSGEGQVTYRELLRRVNAVANWFLAAGMEKGDRIAGLLKRTALATYPREDVAGLTGEAWTEWLAETGNMALPAPIVRALKHNLYGGGETDSQVLIDFASRWIQRHRRGSRC